MEKLTLNYFGTNLDSAGHYFWILEDSYISTAYGIGFNKIPFNPEEYPRYSNADKGDVDFHQFEGYTIFAIEGSCYDKRSGTTSVFWVKEIISLDQMLNKIKSNVAAMKIINAMPFKVNWE